MTALVEMDWAFWEQVADGLAFLAILTGLVALAVAFAPEMPARRLPAPVKRMRDTGRY